MTTAAFRNREFELTPVVEADRDMARRARPCVGVLATFAAEAVAEGAHMPFGAFPPTAEFAALGVAPQANRPNGHEGRKV